MQVRQKVMQVGLGNQKVSFPISYNAAEATAESGSGVPIASELADVNVAYMKDTDTAASASPASLTAMTEGGAWVSNGLAELDGTAMPGVYTFGIPNDAISREAFAAGGTPRFCVLHVRTTTEADTEDTVVVLQLVRSLELPS